MSNELENAFRELQAEYATTTGKPQKVKIGSKSFDAIIEEATFDDIELAGGNADAGGVRVMIAVADHPKKPEGEIEVDGVTWDILLPTKTNGTTWTIVAGDKASE